MLRIAFLLTIFSLSAHARMTVVRDECEGRDWSRTRCEFLDRNPFDMDYSAETDKNSRIVDLGGWLGTLTEQMENINRSDLSCFSDDGRLARLTDYTRRVVNRRRLSDCQRACVVKCITANYITYGDGPGSGMKKDSACQAANSGRGLCRAFANLADHLMDDLGLRSQSRASEGHAFNKIWLNNSWYYGEPQDSECRFFRR